MDINDFTDGQIDYFVRETADAFKVHPNDGSVSLGWNTAPVEIDNEELMERLTDGSGNVTAAPLLYCKAGAMVKGVNFLFGS